MTQTLESYIQTKANFIADYLFSNSLSPFNGGKSITTPLLGKVVGFYTGIIMPTSGYVRFPVPRCYDSFVTSKTEADEDKLLADWSKSSIKFANDIANNPDYHSLVAMEHLSDFTRQLIPACNIFNVIYPHNSNNMKIAEFAKGSETPGSFDGMTQITTHIYRTIQELFAPQEAIYINDQLCRISYVAEKHYLELCLSQTSSLKVNVRSKITKQIENCKEAINTITQENSLIIDTEKLTLL